jgi:hypothetical protein
MQREKADMFRKAAPRPPPLSDPERAPLAPHPWNAGGAGGVRRAPGDELCVACSVSGFSVNTVTPPNGGTAEISDC